MPVYSCFSRPGYYPPVVTLYYRTQFWCTIGVICRTRILMCSSMGSYDTKDFRMSETNSVARVAMTDCATCVCQGQWLIE